jgi:hypothetical protein
MVVILSVKETSAVHLLLEKSNASGERLGKSASFFPVRSTALLCGFQKPFPGSTAL